MKTRLAVFGLLLLLVTSPLRAAIHIVARHGWAVARYDSLEALRSARPFDFAWIWTEEKPPIRLMNDDLDCDDGWVLDRLRKSRKVTVTLERDPAVMRIDLDLVFAPLAMWREIPEDFLPRMHLGYKTKAVELSPASDTLERWRVRAFGASAGSWWTDGGKTTRLPIHMARDVSIQITGESRTPAGDGSATVLESSQGPAKRVVLAEYLVSDKGWIRIPSVPDAGELVILASDAEHVPTAVTARASNLPDRIVLRTGVQVAGRVLGSDDKPIGGVTVRCEGWTSDDGGAQLFSKAAQTAPDGSFGFDRFPRNDLILTLGKAGYATSTLRLKPSDGHAVDAGRIILAKGRQVVIRVRDEEGAAIAKASVRANADPRERIADAKGVVTADGLPMSDDILSISAQGFLAADCPVPEQAKEVVCILPRSFRVTGRFVSSGAPPRLKITSNNRDDFSEVAPNGAFAVDLQPNTPYDLTFSSSAAAPFRVRLSGASGEVRDLGALRPETGIVAVGRVIQPDGTPVADARVWAPRPAPGGLLVSWATGDVAEATSDRDGAFRIGGLATAATALRVDAAGSARTFVQLDPSAGEPVIHVGDVVMRRGGTVVVRSRDEHEHATAIVEPAANALDFDRVKADLSSRTATLHHVPEGEVRVRVVTGSTVLCEGGLTVVDGETSDFSCNDRTMTVRGVVRVGDRSATGGMLQWMPSVEDVGPALIVTRRSTSGMQTQELFGGNGAPLVVPIGASGNFETDLLRPGHYEVVLSSDVGSLTMRAPIEIPSVEQFVTEIHFDAGTLRGVVVDGDGSPIDGAEVRELNAHAVAISDASGSFEIHSVALGTARVQARKGSKASAVLDVAIKTDTTDGVVVRLRQSTPRLHIRVLDENGVGASGAFVFVLSASSPPEIVTCDSSGNAQYTFADDAPSLPRFAAVRGDQWIFGSWLNEQTLSSGSITLQVPREAGEISLTSDGSSGVPGIATADGWPLSWLLSAIGARPYVSPAHPLRLPQLPAGTYVVSLGGTTRSVVVEGGRTTAVAFP